jgi:hypothetical protein
VRVFENRKETRKILDGVSPHARVTLTTAGVSSSIKNPTGTYSKRAPYK